MDQFTLRAARHSRIWLTLLPLALALYFGLATTQLNLPGLNFDEALDAVPAMQFVTGQPLDAYATIDLFGRTWPLTVMPYVGCTSTYLLMIPFALWGPSVTALRLTMITLGAITLVVAWGTVRSLFDPRTAGIVILLLAVNPAFVFWTRMGAYISLPLVSLSLGVLWSGWRWYQRGKGRYLALASFCMGLALTTKILAVWLIPALALAWLLLAPSDNDQGRDLLAPLRRMSLETWVGVTSTGLLGLSPFITFNVRHAGDTVRLLVRNLTETELYGVSNLDLATNLRIVFAQDLVELLNGAWFADLMGGLQRNAWGLQRNAWALPIMAIALVILGWQAYERRLPYPRRVALLIILIVVITAQSAVTVSNLGANHLAILWPWPQTLVALAAGALSDRITIRVGRVGRTAALLGLVPALALMTSDAATVIRYHHQLARTGGHGHSSDAIYALADDLDRPEALPVVALVWGFKRNLQLLTANRVNPEDGYTFTQQPDESYRAWVEGRLDQAPALYLAHTPPYTAFGGHEALFNDAVYRMGRIPKVVHTYHHRDGAPVYRLYSIEPTPPLAGLPARASPLPARFANTTDLVSDEISLLGHDAFAVPWSSGERVVFSLYWRADTPVDGDYQVFVHLVGDDEQIMAQHDGVPALWTRPTSTWQTGEIIADRIILTLPSDVPPGSYRLWAGLYRQEDGTRLAANQNGHPLPDDRLLVAETYIAP